jgi:VWFA-related protein
MRQPEAQFYPRGEQEDGAPAATATRGRSRAAAEARGRAAAPAGRGLAILASMKPLHAAALALLLALPQGQPMFRSTAAVIEVDVIVRGANGFVHGLTADDFEVREDGKPHAIQQFYLVSSGGGSSVDPAAARQASRMFLLVFDLDHLGVEALTRLKIAAESFITSELGPTDVAGIVANGRVIGGRLTNVKPELLRAISTLKPVPDARAVRMQKLREFPRIESEFEASRIEQGDARMLREAAERVCAQNQQLCLSEGGHAIITEKLELKARQYVDEARGAAGGIMRALTTLISGLGRMPGRKTLVLITEGFFVEESIPALQQLAARAARNGVAIYGLDGRGLAGSGTRQMVDAITEGSSLSTAFDTASRGPELLAGSTGGFVVRNASHFAGALGDIARDTSTYYVIGYAPERTTLDGKFRKVEVRAKGKAQGLEVRARKGYLATPLPPAATARGGG